MSTTPVSRDAVSSAVAALGKWMHGRSAASKPQLLLDDRDDFFVLLLSLRRIPSNCRTNPFFLPIPHPIFPISDPTLAPSVFLIIDDRAAESPPPSKFLEEAKECNLPISEVIGISTLRTDYRAFESRRKLCGSHDLFLADKKILPLLPRLLGKSFFQKKKNPLPVNLSRVGWKDQIKRILNSTYFYLRSGTCCAIRVGRLAMEVEQVVDNVMAAINEAVEKIPKKWGNVRSLNLKAVDSVALPIYQAVPEIGLKIEIGDREVGEEFVEGDGEDEGKKEKNKKRKNRSKEDTGGETNLDEIEAIKKKKKAGTGGDEEAKLKKKKKAEIDGAGDKFDVLETEVKSKKKKKKKKNRQENIEVEEINCLKTEKKENIGNVDRKLSNEIVKKMQGEGKKKGKNLEADKEVKKGKKNKTKIQNKGQQMNHNEALVRCEYSMANFSTGDRTRRPKGDRRSTEISLVIRQTMEACILTKLMPRSQIDIFVQVLQADGGKRSACINAATLALADAGVPMCDIVTSCSAGYLCTTPLLDLNYAEDSAGGPDVTLGILAKMDKVTLLQMDAKLPLDTFENVIKLAIEGCKAVAQYIREILLENTKQLESRRGF